MANKDKIKPPVEIVFARFNILSETINELYQSGDMVLESELIETYHNAIDLFYQSIDQSILKTVPEFKAGQPADPRELNDFTGAIQQDLRAIYAEIGALDKLVTASFNSVILEQEQILQISKRISNKLGDYLLYADPSLGAGYFFGDSFNTKEKVDNESTLLEGDECYHSPEEGAILLPLDESPDRPDVNSVIINKPSNGFSGNNHQIDVVGHDAIETISDNEPNTWFEYEKVSSNESSVPLILDLTIALKEIAVINHININPINFGTPTPVKILTIETSRDGIEYRNIKEDIPIKDFVPIIEDSVFELSSATSNFSGQGFYSFQARKAQYIHVVFQQSSPYSIETINGSRLRYAIGLRDVNVLGRKFKSSGSLVSLPFNVNGEARKISLWAAENPVDKSILADVSHGISHDDGATWLPIQPQERDGHEVPEVIDFNTVSPDAIQTEEPVSSLRHKITLTRDTKAFSGNSVIKETVIKKLDLVNVPTGGDFDVSLTEEPIKNTVRAILPFAGSFSCPRPRAGEEVLDESTPMDLDFIEFSIDAPGERIITEGSGATLVAKSIGTLRYKLPFKDIPDLAHHIRVFVNGAQIEYVSKAEGSALAALDENSKVYYLNKGGSELQFRHKDLSGDMKGFIPQPGSTMKICLDGDNPFLRLTDRGYVLNLTKPSDGDKDMVSLAVLKTLKEEEATQYEIEIPPGTKTFRSTLTDENIGEYLSPTSTGDDSHKITTYSTSLSPELIPVSQQEEEDTLAGTGSSFGEGQYAPSVPVFLPGLSNFTVKEYDLDGNLLTGNTSPLRQWDYPVEFIDGYSELQVEGGHYGKYTFDSETGTVYLRAPAIEGRRTVLVCNKLDIERIPIHMWKFDKDNVTNRINPQKIILDPRAVHTIKQEYIRLEGNSSRTISLFTENGEGDVLVSTNTQEHSFYNKRLVRGTVKPSISLFTEGASPTEVPFIDGIQEFSNVVLTEEPMVFTSTGVDLWSHTLIEIDGIQKTLTGSPGFSPVRSLDSTISPVNEFNLDGQKASVSNLGAGVEGDWAVTDSGSIVTITIKSSSRPENHTVLYRFINEDSGVDTNGLYSIDYINGVVHFAKTISTSGTIQYEISMYSSFYNMGEVIKDGDIREVNIGEKKIYFSPAFGIRFLKQDIISRQRPQVMKIYYEYSEKSTESLADLEPYFSPVCKDIAFRAVTSDVLEEL